MHIKRHFMRWRVDEKVEVKYSGISRFIDATIHDISLMGMQISLDEELPQEKAFPMTVRSSTGLQWKVEPWVAWHTQDEKEHYYGVYFARISDPEKEKIWGFINNSCREQVCSHRWQDAPEDSRQPHVDDRRVFQRFPLHCPMIFSDSPQGARYNAEIVDFSAKGIGMISPLAVPEKKRLQMWLHFPCQQGDLQTRGTVAWSRQLESGRYRLGVQLDSADLMGITGLIR